MGNFVIPNVYPIYSIIDVGVNKILVYGSYIDSYLERTANAHSVITGMLGSLEGGEKNKWFIE